MGDGQTSRRYRLLRKQFRTEGQRDDARCWLCGCPIDWTLDWPDDQAWELDHLYPRSTHPQHAEDPANFRHSHRACNRTRSNGTPKTGTGTPTRNWLG